MKGLFFGLIFLSVFNCRAQKNADSLKIDGIAAILRPKPFFSNNCYASLSHDTLLIVASSNYAYYPFGKIAGEKGLKQSLLGKFKVETKKKASQHFQYLSFKNSSLILCFDTIEQGVIESYIVRGAINDSAVSLTNNVRIGMSEEAFLNTFFTSLPKELGNQSNVIVFKCCATDIIHYYSFKDKKLATIKFAQDGVSPYTIDRKK